jgi:hypothetical protein
MSILRADQTFKPLFQVFKDMMSKGQLDEDALLSQLLTVFDLEKRPSFLSTRDHLDDIRRSMLIGLHLYSSKDCVQPLRNATALLDHVILSQ